MHDPGYPLPGLPDGYEAVGLRPMRIGEEIWDEVGGIVTAKVNGTTARLIVRKIWQWPDWIQPGHWIAMDEDGCWYLYSAVPVLGDHIFSAEGGLSAPLALLALLDWTPPPCSDWRKSAMQKPVEERDEL